MAASRQIVVFGNILGRLASADIIRPGVAGAGVVMLNHQPSRESSQKHYDPRFRKHRAKKVAYKEPIIRLIKEAETEDETRILRKKLGLPPENNFSERQLNLTHTGGIVEEYKPPEGDGQKSSLLPRKVRPVESTKQMLKSYKATRRMKQYEPHFKQAEFLKEAQQIYFEAQKLLEDYKKNEDRLHDLVTDHALSLMVAGLNTKTLRWNFKESVEPPKVVQVRCEEAITKENYFTQITVRFHTQQSLAVYDRFGRLMFGNENLFKNIVEYVVFEKHSVDTYGKWRVHAKIIPDWMPPREPMLKTFRKKMTDQQANTSETAVAT